MENAFTVKVKGIYMEDNEHLGINRIEPSQWQDATSEVHDHELYEYANIEIRVFRNKETGKLYFWDYRVIE